VVIDRVSDVMHNSRGEMFSEFVGSRMARYKKPHYVEMVTSLPLKADKTPDREKIKALYSGES
jgi:acyl-CoA synthetase (AMP-forming)/AMP-acid ligase II